MTVTVNDFLIVALVFCYAALAFAALLGIKSRRTPPRPVCVEPPVKGAGGKETL